MGQQSLGFHFAHRGWTSILSLPSPLTQRAISESRMLSQRVSEILDPTTKKRGAVGFTGRTEFMALGLVDNDSKYNSEMITILGDMIDVASVDIPTWYFLLDGEDKLLVKLFPLFFSTVCLVMV